MMPNGSLKNIYDYTFIISLTKPGMMQKFIRNKLTEKLQSYVEFESTSLQQLSLHNLSIKPNLMDQLSQGAAIPLTLIKGTISSLKINKAWDKIFAINKDDPLVIEINGIKINAKLPNQLQRSYVHRRRKQIIKQFTQSLNEKIDNDQTFLAKLRQYFFGAIVIEIKDVTLQIEMNLKHSIVITLGLDAFKLQKQKKIKKTEFIIDKLSLSYRLRNDTKNQYIINEAHASFFKQSNNKEAINKFIINNFNLSVNNENFNDIRRVIEIIKWHNSFVNLAESLWKEKPSIIGSVSSKHKLKYICELMRFKIVERKSFTKILAERRIYLKLYQQVNKEPTNKKLTYQLEQLQQKMEIWKIKAYRKFYHDLHKKNTRQKINEINPNIPEKQSSGILYESSWIRSWFRTKQQRTMLNQLQDKLNRIEIKPVKETLEVKIEQIQILLNIRSHHNQPFLNFCAVNNLLVIQKNPKTIQNQVEYDKIMRFSVQRFMVQFDKYNGHCQQCRYLLHEDNLKKISGDSEFEDIENFLEVQVRQHKTKIEVQPITIVFNQQIKQKIQIFKLQRIHNNFESAENLIILPTPEQNDHENNKRQILLNGSLQIIIPESMYHTNSQSITIYLNNISYRSDQFKKKFTIKSIDINSLLYVEKQYEYSISQSIVAEKQFHYEVVQLIRTSVSCQIDIHESINDITVNISSIKLKLEKVNYLCKLIKFLSRFKSKSKPNRQLTKLRNIRRKQTIGQEFIDACENLNEHIVRSVVSSDITKKEKYVKKEKKDMKLVVYIKGLFIGLEEDEVQIGMFSVNAYQFTDSKSLHLEDEKKVVVKIKEINKLLSNLKTINQEIDRTFKSQNKQPEKKVYDTEVGNSELKIYNMILNVVLYQKNEPKMVINFSNVELQKKKNESIYVKLSAHLVYYPNKIYCNRKICNEIETPIESFNFYYHQEKGYNKDERLIKIGHININIKPILIQEISLFLQTQQVPQKKVYWVSNHMVTPVNISTNGNTYVELKQGNEAAGLSSKCDIIYTGRKQILDLNEDLGPSTFFVTDHIRLIKTNKQKFHYGLRSSFRITNQHDRLLCLRILKKPNEINHHKSLQQEVDFQFLSRATNTKTNRRSYSIPRSRSLNKLSNISDSEQEEDKESQRIQKKSLNLSKGQRQIIEILIKPKKTIDLIVDSQELYIEIIDMNPNGVKYEIFETFRICDIIKGNAEKNLKAIWSSEDIEHNLVIRSNLTVDEELDIKILDLQIMSPIIIINELPWPLKYKYNKEQIDFMETIKTECRQVRKRSFQVIPMEQVNPFSSSQNRHIRYQDITELEVRVKDYFKYFRLDHIISDMIEREKRMKQQEAEDDLKVKFLYTHLCLNDGKKQLQVILQINLTSHMLQIRIYPQYIFLNMTSLNIELAVEQNNYTYPLMKLNPLTQKRYYKNYLKMNESQLEHEDIFKQLFSDYSENIAIFTGSLDAEVNQTSSLGHNSPKQNQIIFKKNLNSSALPLNRQNMIEYSEKSLKVIIRKIILETSSPINFIIFMPSLLIINKSDWTFFVKGEGEGPKKLQKHEIEYVIISCKINIQACQQQEEISYGEWLKITLNSLGTIYYAKQMTQSNGYESREYQLRKKRLKKVPKIFFRIVMTRYEFGYQMLIEESQYPPVTFINRSKTRIKIYEVKEQTSQEMQNNQMAQYAPKIPQYEPTFSLSMVENYQFIQLGEFNLSDTEKNFKKVRVNIEQYKDKKIVIIQDYVQRYLSQIRNELLLEKIQKINLIIDDFSVSVLNSDNKELSCSVIKEIDLLYESKSTKKYLKLTISNIETFSYHNLQPTYLFHCKEQEELFQIFKKKNYQPNEEFLKIELVVDYHKHATILEKCAIKMMPVTIIINANNIIDYIKYYYECIMALETMIKRLNRQKPGKNNNGKEKKGKSSWLHNNFIIERFVWEGFKIKIKSENLNNLCLFFDQRSIDYFIRCITWLGDLKPLVFSEVLIQYEQYNFDKMSKMVDIKAIFYKITQMLLHYPLQQVYNLVNLIATFAGLTEPHERQEKLNTLKKITSSTVMLLAKLLASGGSEVEIKKQQYRRWFKQNSKNTKSNFIEKIMEFKYAEWKINEECNPYKLNVKVMRFERYTNPKTLEPYDKIYARIKVAIDSHNKNKIYREIKYAAQINYETLIGVTEQWVVIYFVEKDEWIVVKPEKVLSFELRRSQKKGNVFIVYIMRDQQSISHKQLKKLYFDETLLEKPYIQEIWSFIYNQKLLTQY